MYLCIMELKVQTGNKSDFIKLLIKIIYHKDELLTSKYLSWRVLKSATLQAPIFSNDWHLTAIINCDHFLTGNCILHILYFPKVFIWN